MIICQMLIKFLEGPKNSLFKTHPLQPFTDKSNVSMGIKNRWGGDKQQ